MNGMRFLVVCLGLVWGLEVFSQDFPQDNWYPGSAVLTTGEEKKGQIKYDLESNSIQLESDNKIETFHASQFNTFSIYMDRENMYRAFYVLPYAGSTGYKRPTIFELIVEGELSLLAREYIVTRGGNANPSVRTNGFVRMSDPFGLVQQFLGFNLYLVDKRANVIELTTNRKEVVAAFGEHQKDLKKYIKEEKLKTDNLIDMAQLVNYFNTLNTKS